MFYSNPQCLRSSFDFLLQPPQIVDHFLIDTSEKITHFLLHSIISMQTRVIRRHSFCCIIFLLFTLLLLIPKLHTLVGRSKSSPNSSRYGCDSSSVSTTQKHKSEKATGCGANSCLDQSCIVLFACLCVLIHCVKLHEKMQSGERG